MIETYLKTSELAEHLGVHSSTIKRWVDRGELPANRTVGKHRLIPLSGAIRFARERGLPASGLFGLLGDLRESPGDGGEVGDGPPSWQTLAEALKRGRGSMAREMIRRAMAAGVGAIGLADDLIRPAMEQIGRDWESHTLDVYQEHRASRIVESAVMELLRCVSGPPDGAPLAIGASPAGDPYTISGLLCELSLREQGWEAVNLGPNLPMSSMGKAVLAHRPRLAWISVSHLLDPGAFADDYAEFYATASRTGTAVVLGGAALSPVLRTRLLAASFGERLAHLGEFARGMHPRAALPGTRDDRSMDRPASSQS